MDVNGRANNSISISVNPEIREYSESVFWGLTLRQFLFTILGCAVSIGIFFLLRDVLGMEAVSWACILGMLPCALLGFVRYNGMTAEQLLMVVIRSEILMPKGIVFRPVNQFEEVLKTGEKLRLQQKKKRGKNFDKGKKTGENEDSQECTGSGSGYNCI